MKLIAKSRKRGELQIYLIIWLVVLLMPVFMSYSAYGFRRGQIGHEWLRILPFLLIFLLHNFLFFPKYFLNDKRGLYFLVTILAILIICGLWILTGPFLNSSVKSMTEPHPGAFPGLGNLPAQMRPWYVNLGNSVLVSMLVVGFNASIKLTVKWQEEEQKNRILEKEKLQAELAFLRNQVSPHFFMNTLNNIHALIDIDSEDAKESIVKLSRLMRYLLYDSEKGMTTLEKEVEFIKSYVELMKLRLLPNVEIKLSFPSQIPDVKIPSLLFISLVENAFKYGISYQEKSFIDIKMKAGGKDLDFNIRNSVHPNESFESKGGLGLKNLKKRLELLFDDDFTLTINKNDNIFRTRIVIPIHGN